MIGHLRGIAIFAKTVELGSFHKAAKALNLSPSVVSHHISQLEDQLGVTLLYRTTRSLSLTAEGERMIEAARTMVSAAEDGIRNALDHAEVLSGDLRVTVPALLAQSRITDQIAGFAQSHPGIRITVDYSEIPRDIVADGIDVAIRMGWLRDSSLKARRLYDLERILVAAPSLVKTMPSPETPKDVERWPWLSLAPVPLRPVFRSADNQRVSLQPTARLSVNNAHALYALARRGAGLTLIPRFMAEADLASGAMHHLLPAWQTDPISVYAVRPGNAARKGPAAAFVKALTAAA